MGGECRGRRIGIAGEAGQAGKRRRTERTRRIPAAVEDPPERRGQAGRGRGIGPARRALVDRRGQQRLPVVRFARPGGQLQVERAPAVHVAAPDLPARLFESRAEPRALRAAKAQARVAHRRPIGLLAIDLANLGPRLRIVRNDGKCQPAIRGHREPGGEQILPSVEIGEPAADQPERDATLGRREHRPEPGIGMGEHDFRLESAGCQGARGLQGSLPLAVRLDQAVVLGAQTAEIDGAADHQRPLPGGRPFGERLRGEARGRGQPGRASGGIGRRSRRAGGKVGRPARKLRGEHPASRAETSPRRVALARHLDRQPIGQNQRRGGREKSGQPRLLGALFHGLLPCRHRQAERREGDQRAQHPQATGRGGRRTRARSGGRRAHG